MSEFRLLIDAPLPGPENMARDEALLLACAPESAPTLRFYAWSPPTISLGYFQELDEVRKLDAPVRDLAVVRRTTGGGAILHDLEVTYSLTLPADHPLVRGRPNELYRLAHEAVIAAVGVRARFATGACGACGESSQRGPFFCFARRHGLDVVVDDAGGPDGTAKLAGSAQRRTTGAILQHGSIILDSRYPQQPCATWRRVGGVYGFDDAVGRLAKAFADSLEMSPRLDDWRAEELERAGGIIPKYAGEGWTVHRVR